MGIDARQVVTNTGAGVSSITLTWSSTPTQGNLLYISLAHTGALTLTPSGWTALTQASTTGTQLNSYYKIAGAAEVSVTVSFFFSSSNVAAGGVEYAYQSDLPTPPLANQVTNSGTSTTTHDSSNIASLSADRSLLICAASVNNTTLYSGLNTGTTIRAQPTVTYGFFKTHKLFILDRDEENKTGSDTQNATASAALNFANNHAEFYGIKGVKHILTATRRNMDLSSRVPQDFREDEQAIMDLWR